MESAPYFFTDPLFWCHYYQQQTVPSYLLASSFCVALPTVTTIDVTSYTTPNEPQPAKQETASKERPNTVSPPSKTKIRSRTRVAVDQTDKRRLYEERRARTNVGNMLLTFLYLKRRSNYHIERLFPAISLAEKEAYYSFIVPLKRSCSGYLNENRLQQLWKPAPELDNFNYEILRTLSHYFLRQELPLAVVTSTRMQRRHRLAHLRMGRKLLYVLSKIDE